MNACVFGTNLLGLLYQRYNKNRGLWPTCVQSTCMLIYHNKHLNCMLSLALSLAGVVHVCLHSSRAKQI